ncbi:hypothetical protein FIBSPDRAFT_908692 [Athelia psychrophila]|uniref:CxC2-like cysteine cluster KDZ transposase-associated domain-containing protein n=1 Tax=Athelia psychrophila TaxID=1759441 RepID=A0A166RIB0_9AGAM|nr:hypothetical protein FIBSPDRAFT_908692 [Fibularhizoctonia sp. CBS 109695]
MGMRSTYHIRVMDIYRIIPTASSTPILGFCIKTMELYCTAHFRCPRLSVQAFVRTMMDLQGEPHKKYRSKQFSITYDLYLEIQRQVEARVNKALGRNDPSWSIRNVCPPCMYKVEGEPPLKFSMLSAMDGNDSLKRFDLDNRTAPSSMYISRAQVDKWAPKPGSKKCDPEDDAVGPCREHWKNIKQEATARAFGVFGETGVFCSFCRHGFNLTIADMYRTGEQSKYALATEEVLMDAHGANQGNGYDIACAHCVTLNNSELGPRARELNYTPLVDAFHGHTHNRLCQLKNLTSYVDGLGLDALGVCEQAFSKSNELAGSTRTMGTFHRQQAIGTFFRDTDNFDNYRSMTKYIHNMYKKSLEILRKTPAALELSMKTLGIEGLPFKEWLLEETRYLEELAKEPPQETLQMEYCQRLKYLWNCEALHAAITSVGFHATDPTARDGTNAIETCRRHAIENYEKAVAHVQNLEVRLGIDMRWTVDSPEFAETARMLAMRDYQRALDALEGLVVARLSELTSMNRAGMASSAGYNMRKHIGKALQTRSAAIKTALERYNTAARGLNLPREELNLGTLLRAPEEILRCNVEIRRIITHLRDEENFLRHHEERLCAEGKTLLAHQISLH